MPLLDSSARLAARLGVPPDVFGNPDWQSGLVRVVTSLFGAAYIGLGAWTHYYEVDVPYFLTIFAPYLVLSLALLLSVVRRPRWLARRYLALCLDIVVVSLAISITREAISPFYLLYILIFISSGTRFGRNDLILAAVVAVIAYNGVLIELDEWRRHTFEAFFFLLLLVLLPLYQAALLGQVQRAREDAVRANQAKGDFLAVMTHELRTPLTAVIGLAELLADTDLDEEQREHVRAISGSAAALNVLIGDVLDFSKIDAGKLTLERIPFDPGVLLRDACALLEVQSLPRGLELVLEVAPEVPGQVVGDPHRVRQILFNLLGNAIKFTEQGQVRVRLGCRESSAAVAVPHLLLEVIDTGIGIPQDKLATLFESFHQADDSTTRRFGGTGLGTTIARQLAERMGGTIEVESELGRGSRFLVRLPLPIAEPPSPPGSGRLVGARVLILERNTAYRDFVAAILEHERALCRTAEPGESLPSAPVPELLVLADEPAGRDLTAELHGFRARCDAEIPCLLLSYGGRQRAHGLARVMYLNKPFLPRDLVRAAAMLLDPERYAAYVAEQDASRITLAAPSLGGIRVLVAEDNVLAARVITAFLTRMGVDHRLFEDGESALAAALAGGFHIAFVDLRMPRLDGLGFTRRYRAESNGRPLTIMALTAGATEDARRDCLAAGMDGFMTKPVDRDELHAILERYTREVDPGATAAGGLSDRLSG
mgnify:CR=1 FL=1